MAKDITGKTAIPVDMVQENLKMANKGEERKPFWEMMTALNHDFTNHLADRYSLRTAHKHALVIDMFIEFLTHQTNILRLEEVTVGMANSYFHAWYQRKVKDSTSIDERRIAIKKFFSFLNTEKGIINHKVLGSFSRTPKIRASIRKPTIVGHETVILRVKLVHNKRVYRDLEAPLDKSLYTLAGAILNSFNFDMDHAFGFFATGNPRHYYDAPERYELFVDQGDNSTPGSKSVKRTKLSKVFFLEKQKMIFLFDYGDTWLFELEVRGFGHKITSEHYPRVLVARGESPEQYSDFEDEED